MHRVSIKPETVKLRRIRPKANPGAPEMRPFFPGRAAFAFCFMLALCAQSPDAQEIRQIWRGALPGSAAAPPVPGAGSVTVLCDGGGLICYGVSGTQLWSFSGGGRLTRFMGRSPEGMTYVCRTNGVFFALNKTGHELWRAGLGSPLAAPVMVGADGRLILFTRTGILCYTASGTRLWRYELQSPLAFPPRVTADGYFLAGLEDGSLLELSPFGRVQTRRFAGPLADALQIDQRTLMVFAVSGQADLVPGSGYAGPSWTWGNLGGTPLAAAQRGRNAAVLLSSGQLLLLEPGNDAAPPAIRWRVQALSGETARTPMQPEAALYYDDRGIHVAAKSQIIQFDWNGRELRRYRLPNPASAPPALAESGIVYSGGADWILYAYRFGDASAERAPGSVIRANAYGMANPGPENREMYEYGFDDAEIGAVLASIRRTLDTGTTGSNEWRYVEYLMEISANLGRSAETTPLQRRLEPYSAVALTRRVAALELLGRLGTRDTIAFLAGIYTGDPEPVIKAAAAAAIGRIGIDPEGIALRAFMNLIYGPVSYHDEQVLLATAGAAGSLALFSGPPANEDCIRLLASFDSPSRPQTVRRRARQALARLR